MLIFAASKITKSDMSKFIEFSEVGYHTRTLVNIDNILAVMDAEVGVHIVLKEQFDEDSPKKFHTTDYTFKELKKLIG